MTTLQTASDLSLAGAARGAPLVTRESTRMHEVAEAARADAPTARVGVSPRDVGIYAASAVSALAATWLGYDQLTRASGVLGFGLCAFAVFLVLVYVVNRELEGRLVALDRVWTAVVTAGALLLLVPLVLVIGWVIGKGLAALRPNFFTRDLATVGGDQGVDAGGAVHAIVGTVEQVGIAVLLAVPLGVMTAIFLNEVRGPLRRPVRLFVDAMSGIPSIIAGLFVYALLIQSHVIGFSGFAAALALTILMLPTIARTGEEVLRLVPSGLREASLAMGASQWRTVWSVVLPTAKSGLITSVVLGVARAVGETAPLLTTAGFASVTNGNPAKDQQAALPTYIYNLYRSPSTFQQQRAATGALVLVALVLILFTTARVVGSRQPGQRGMLRRLLGGRTRMGGGSRTGGVPAPAGPDGPPDSVDLAALEPQGTLSPASPTVGSGAPKARARRATGRRPRRASPPADPDTGSQP